MAIRVRCYIFDADGTLKRVPRRVMEGLTLGDDALPEYAGTQQRAAEVIVENEDGRPVRILDAQGVIWAFDAEGRIDKSLNRSARKVMQFAFELSQKSSAKVVDLRPELQRKKWRNEFRWDLSGEDVDRIAADLWPALANAQSVKTVKGKAPKVPPLTSDARRVIEEIHAKLAATSASVDELTELALKGFTYEARRLAASSRIYGPIWAAIAAEADKSREIKARHRTGKGAFFAAVRIWREDEPGYSREVDSIERRCESKALAIETARKLLAENAHRFDDKVSLEAYVFSELEWVPGDDDEIAPAIPVEDDVDTWA